MIAIRVHSPTFNPLAYTLDVLLPIVDLGQKSAWQPQGPTLYWSWALTLAGWVLTTAVVAGLALLELTSAALTGVLGIPDITTNSRAATGSPNPGLSMLSKGIHP